MSDARLERIGRLAAVARGLEREGAYNGAKLVRAALERELIRYAEAEAPTGVVIERDYDPSLPRLRLDRNHVIQALLNLGRNAIQAVGSHGRIVLRTRALTNASIGSRRYRVVASIQVEDDGPGVPTELKDTVFYPLVTGRQGGTGLGLAVAQDLVGRHDGLIEFDSRPGRTIFTILLPLDTNESSEKA